MWWDLGSRPSMVPGSGDVVRKLDPAEDSIENLTNQLRELQRQQYQHLWERDRHFIFMTIWAIIIAFAILANGWGGDDGCPGGRLATDPERLDMSVGTRVGAAANTGVGGTATHRHRTAAVSGLSDPHDAGLGYGLAGPHRYVVAAEPGAESAALIPSNETEMGGKEMSDDMGPLPMEQPQPHKAPWRITFPGVMSTLAVVLATAALTVSVLHGGTPGPQGPTGQPGPAGLQGPAGPAGPTGASAPLLGYECQNVFPNNSSDGTDTTMYWPCTPNQDEG
jgi:hypothetical protein